MCCPALVLSFKEKKQSEAEAAEVISNMLFGELQGPRAGPLRWAFHKKNLSLIWEWKGFVALPWQAAFMHCFARRIENEFGEDQVSYQMCTRVPMSWLVI